MKPRPRANGTSTAKPANSTRRAARVAAPGQPDWAGAAAVPGGAPALAATTAPAPAPAPLPAAAAPGTPASLRARAPGRSRRAGAGAGSAEQAATKTAKVAVDAPNAPNAAPPAAAPAGKALRADGEATRARILEAAGELAAQAGFAATPSKAIAARAQVDLASINYHFGGRAGLHQAVLVEAHRRFVSLPELQRLAAANCLPAVPKLRLLMHMLSARALDARGWHGRVLLRELASPSPALAQALAEEAPPKLAVSLGILSEVAGIPPHEPALLRCALSVMAPFITLTLAGSGIPVPLQSAVQADAQEVGEHLFRFALAGLQAAGRDWAAGKDAPCQPCAPAVTAMP